MTFTINKIEYEIIEKTQKEIKEYMNTTKGNEEKEDVESKTTIYYGASMHYVDKIFLDKDLPRDRKRRTLLHELGHIYITNYITHQDKHYDEEMVCDILANSFDIITKIVNKYFEEEGNGDSLQET